MDEKQLPEGLELGREGGIKVKSGYRSTVEFDEILPGDLIIYRYDPNPDRESINFKNYAEMGYHFVKNRTRDNISGWHFGRENTSVNWEHDYSSWTNYAVEADRVSPSLVTTILKFYEKDNLLKALLEGDAKVK
ncbi:MAG TPA: hypothetical protein VJC39_04115 [Candidatus Nanoarchaeia archaeon]|nr:hypothetical protein [Candidatus Nanoarchaeia archaeon]